MLYKFLVFKDYARGELERIVQAIFSLKMEWPEIEVLLQQNINCRCPNSLWGKLAKIITQTYHCKLAQ